MKRTRQSRPRITITDVARTAAVSPTTVSNVLNGRTEAMTPETLLRVQSAIRQLKYRPNSAARGLVTHRTATIGVILAEIETPLFLQALPFIEPIARRVGYNVLLCIARNTPDEQQALNLLLEKQVDGIIFLSTSHHLDDHHLLELKQIGLPVVLVNRACEYGEFDQINWANAAGVEQAVDHLVRLGHRQIALLTGPEKRRSSSERWDGYRIALERNGISYHEQYVRPGDYTASQEMWKQSMRDLLTLRPRPTAVIASDDIVAAVVMSTIQSLGLRVPEDIAVVGFDDQPFCIFLNPSLTTIQLPIVEAGKRAAEMLLQRISGKCTEIEHLTLPCSLVPRDSTGRRTLSEPIEISSAEDTGPTS